jgi:DNA-directed RNA polymerase specialized sigma24 family protein
VGKLKRSVGSPVEVDDAVADIKTLHARYRDHLLGVAVTRYQVPEADAEDLIHEALLAFVHLPKRKRIANGREWLAVAVGIFCRQYWRAKGRTDTLPDDIDEQAGDRLVGKDSADVRAARPLSVLKLFVDTYRNM